MGSQNLMESMRIFIQLNASLLTGNKVTYCRLFITQVLKHFYVLLNTIQGKKCKKHEHFVETNLSIIFFFGKFFGKNGEDIN